VTDIDKTLKMLKSPKADTRYDACEELRVATESSPEVILALEEASQDEDREVAERARLALVSDVHQRMAYKMGRSWVTSEPPPESEIRPYPDHLILDLIICPLIWSMFGIALIYVWSYFWYDYFNCMYYRCIDYLWEFPIWWLLTLICIIIALFKKRPLIVIGVCIAGVLITCLMFRVWFVVV
jgi:hypothetical protein